MAEYNADELTEQANERKELAELARRTRRKEPSLYSLEKASVDMLASLTACQNGTGNMPEPARSDAIVQAHYVDDSLNYSIFEAQMFIASQLFIPGNREVGILVETPDGNIRTVIAKDQPVKDLLTAYSLSQYRIILRQDAPEITRDSVISAAWQKSTPAKIYRKIEQLMRG